MTPRRQHDMRLRAATTDEIKEVWEDRWFGLVVCISTVYRPPDVEGPPPASITTSRLDW